MTDVHSEAASGSRSSRLDRAIRDLLVQAPELEAAAVVSFDGLPMAAALPPSMDEDRVAAMSAALLSLGERAAEGLGRGQLSQVYIEGDEGTVFLVSADDEAVLVAVAAKGAKAGMMLYEVRRAAGVVAAVLRAEELAELAVAPVTLVPVQARSESAAEPVAPASYAPVSPAPWGVHADPVQASPVPAVPDLEPAPRTGYAGPVALPQYDVPTYQVPQYDVPTYEVPHFDLPQYDAPVDLPVQPAPVQAAPVQSAPVQYAEPVPAEPVPYAPAAEPVWSHYAPTGSVMPGGGVPPSTWS
jgi:predicted regulator of Ras-like GTPase activity (Roadblock/LC7/MglB family)